MKKQLCDKKRERKDILELYVATQAVDYLKDPKRVEVIADDVISYYEKRTNADGLRR